MQRDLTKGSVLHNLLLFSVPYLLSCFLQSFYGLADLFITGQFNGAAAISAVSIGSQVTHMLTVVVVGLTMGTTVMIGRAVGSGDKPLAARVIGGTVVLFAAVAAISTAVLLFAADGIITVLSTPAEAVDQTRSYLMICFLGCPFIVAYNVISSIFRGMGDSKSPMYFIAVAGVVNIALGITGDHQNIGECHPVQTAQIGPAEFPVFAFRRFGDEGLFRHHPGHRSAPVQQFPGTDQGFLNAQKVQPGHVLHPVFLEGQDIGTDHSVDAVMAQIRQKPGLVAKGKVGRDSRVRQFKGAQGGEILIVGGNHTDVQLVGVLPAHLPTEILILPHDAFHAVVKALALWRQAGGPARTDKQLTAQLRLQNRNVLAHGRLGNMAQFRRTGKILLLRRTEKIVNLVDVHGRIPFPRRAMPAVSYIITAAPKQVQHERPERAGKQAVKKIKKI